MKKTYDTLIVLPNLNGPGGVIYLYKMLKLDKYETINYFELKSVFKGSMGVVLDYIFFIFKCIKFKKIVINPSLDKKSFLRDALFAIITILLRKKLIVYWHGWQLDFQEKIFKSKLLRFIFRITYGKAKLQIVLAEKFGNSLRELGYRSDIKVFTNTCQFPKEYPLRKNDNAINMLFISRIEPQKGWDIALKTMEYLKSDNVILHVIGDGSCYNEAVKIKDDKKLSNVKFYGYLDGDKKHEILKKCNVTLFPTCYSEGMPLTVLEGAAYGHVIISREEGGILDHMKDFNGFITRSIDPKDFYDFIKNELLNHNLNILGEENYNRAKNNFSIETYKVEYLNTLYYVN